jgi:hypothetical protein
MDFDFLPSLFWLLKVASNILFIEAIALNAL